MAKKELTNREKLQQVIDFNLRVVESKAKSYSTEDKQQASRIVISAVRTMNELFGASEKPKGIQLSKEALSRAKLSHFRVIER